jgi:hypothetical protein
MAHMRSNCLLERQVNELKATVEDYKSSSNEQHRRTDEKLTRLLEVVSQLAPIESRSSTPGLFTPATAAVADTKSYLVNPLPTPELISIVSKVVSEARSRVGKKKSSAEDNSLKVSHLWLGRIAYSPI